MLRLFILALVAASWLPFSVSAQSCQQIVGTVLDKETNMPLPGASIQVTRNPSQGTTTNQEGTFEFAVQANDTIVVTFIGYVPFHLFPGNNCTVRIELSPDPTNLQEVVITAEKLIAEEFLVKKIKRIDIYTNPSAKADPLLAVNSTASATTTDESANISLRGSSPAETGIFLNNVPINDAVRYSQLNGIGTFSIFNTALVNNVQLYAGNPPLEFGNTTSGLIALQTEESIPEKNAYTLSVSLANLGSYARIKTSRNSSLTHYLNYQPSRFIKAINPTSLASVKQFRTGDQGLHFLKQFNPKTLLKIFNYTNHESYQYHAKSPTYDGIYLQQKWRNFTIINVRRQLRNGELSYNQGTGFSTARYTFANLDTHVRQQDFYSSINYLYVRANQECKAGISYDYKSSRYHGTYPKITYAIGENYPTESSASNNSVAVPEAYIYVKQSVLQKLILGTGVRRNIVTSNTNRFTSVQSNLNYQLTKAWNIILSAGKYNKYQLSQSESNIPVWIQSRQFGVDALYKKNNLEGTVSAFSKKSNHDSILQRVRGLEVFVRYKFNSSLRSQLSLTSLRAREEKNGVQLPSVYNISYFLRGNVEYKFQSTWTLTAVFLFRQGSYYTPAIAAQYDSSLGIYQPQWGIMQRLPDYKTIDISASKIFVLHKQYTCVAFAGIGNVANFKNVRGYRYNADYSQQEAELFSLRTLYFGAMISF